MTRKAVIAAGAAGPETTVRTVLTRAGFAPAIEAASVSQAGQLVREQQAELLIVPLQGPSAADLGAIERELSRTPGLYVIGTAPAAEPDLIVRAMRAGVHEFLVYPPSLEELTAAIERMQRRSRPESTSRLTVGVYSAKGGIGTTSIAVNLAFALAGANPTSNVALADYVVSGGDVAVMLNLRPTYDISDVALKLGQLDASVLESVLLRVPQNVAILAASEQPEALDSVDGRAATRILDELRTHFEFTVVDCEHHPTDRMIATLDAVDRIVVVTQLHVSAIRSAQRTLGLFRRLGYDEDKVAVVANRAQQSDLITAADAGRALERDLFFSLPNDYRASEAALTRGLPVVANDPTSALARAYDALAAKLSGGEAAIVPPPTNGQGGRIGRLLGLGRK